MQNLTFGEAIEAVKQGKRIARAGWNGKNTYVLLYRGQEDIAKSFGYGFGEAMGEFQFTDTLAMKTAQNTMQLGWLASQADMLSNDWYILGEE